MGFMRDVAVAAVMIGAFLVGVKALDMYGRKKGWWERLLPFDPVEGRKSLRYR